jgi:hypothetical protein
MQMIEDMKSRDYEMLSANSADSLNVKVKEKLKEGWKQWGSPMCNPMTLDDTGHSLYQAVVKVGDLVE